VSLSIVVTTFNRAGVLRKLLLDLSAQNDLDFEVVVAIDGSTDGTEAMLEKLRLPYDIKWIDTHCRGYGLAIARNLGILSASRPAVAILDDDSFPAPGYVAAQKRSVGSGVITGGPRNPADARNERMAWKMRELAKLPQLTPMAIGQLRRDWPSAYLIENNICMFRDDFVAMGMFSERLKMYGYIGQEFFRRAEFFGLRYQYNPEAAVTHHGEIAGDNGFASRRKTRETWVASLLLPTLSVPTHYRAQAAWAQARARGSDAPLPAYKFRATLALPWRAALMLAGQTRRRLREALT
jgi:glycosyltransferase involved in cell wall biosynthesis